MKKSKMKRLIAELDEFEERVDLLVTRLYGMVFCEHCKADIPRNGWISQMKATGWPINAPVMHDGNLPCTAWPTLPNDSYTERRLELIIAKLEAPEKAETDSINA